MTIKTKYNEGDNVFTIDTNTLKVKEFEIGRITSYTSGGKTSVTCYPKGDSYTTSGYDENKCFPSETELITFVTTKETQA